MRKDLSSRRNSLRTLAGIATFGFLSKLLGFNESIAEGAEVAEETNLAKSAKDFKGKPTVYCTDLFHPHDDPDDHFDLATLFALPELEVKAILLDQGEKQEQKPGRIPLEQIFHLTGKRIPYAIGLAQKLKSPKDTGKDQPSKFQGAVELLLETLSDAAEPVTIVATGSVRDICAAFNRDPDLFRKKVERLYLNIGSAEPNGSEYNVELDPMAYIGLLRSGLPIYLCPCMPMDLRSNHSTFWRFRQSEVLEDLPLGLQNFFIYALQVVRPDEIDPIKALRMNLRPFRHLVWQMERNMWSTASLIAASGRQIFQTDKSYVASLKPLPEAKPIELFSFVPALVEVNENGQTQKIVTNAENANVQLFTTSDPKVYNETMVSVLKALLSQFPVANR